MAHVRVLVVDDESGLLLLLRRYLERLGYDVDTASSAEEALRMFEADLDRYGCIVTDLILPIMGGEEFLDRVRALRPGLPALISSGYPYEPKTPDTGFLQKPYLPAMLTEELERIMRRGRSAAGPG